LNYLSDSKKAATK